MLPPVPETLIMLGTPQIPWEMMPTVRRARFAAALLVLLLALLPPIHVFAVERGERSAEVWLAAVTEDGLGQLFKARVTLRYPGSGKFEAKPSPFVGGDTEASFKLAATLACIVAGVDPSSVDVAIALDTGGERVEGPSASITVFSAVLSLLSNTKIGGVATGTLSPTLLDVTVGGVAEKYAAASTRGVFVYPLGNMGEMAGRGGAEPAATALEAYYRLAGLEDGYIEASITVPPEASTVFAGSARSDLSAVEEAGRRLVRAAGVEPTVEMARDALGGGKAYAAASLAFTAKIRVLLANVSLTINSTTDPRGYAEKLLEEAAKRLDEASLAYNETNATGLWGFEAKAAAAYRMYVAEKYLEKARDALDRGDYRSAAGNATLSLARAETAMVWLQARPPGGPEVLPSLEEVVARSALDLAELTLTYVSRVLERLTPGVLGRSVESYLAEYRGELEDARNAYGGGDYHLALGIALELISTLSGWVEAPIHEKGREILALYSRGLESVVETLYALARFRGYEPLQASLYYEYGSYLASRGNYTSGISILGMASCELLVLRYALVRMEAPSPAPGILSAGSPEAGRALAVASALVLAASATATIVALSRGSRGGSQPSS